MYTTFWNNIGFVAYRTIPDYTHKSQNSLQKQDFYPFLSNKTINLSFTIYVKRKITFKMRIY